MNHVHDCFISASVMASRGISLTEDGFQSMEHFLSFTPASAMASGANLSQDKGFPFSGQFHTLIPPSAMATGDLSSIGKESFPSTDCFGTSKPGSAMATRAFSSKEEEAFPSTDLSLAFPPVSAMARGGFNSNNEEGFPLTGRFDIFIPASGMAAGGLYSKGKEAVLSTDFVETFVPGLPIAAGGFSSKGEVEGFPLMDLSLTLSLPNPGSSRLQQEAADSFSDGSEAEQNRAKIRKIWHNAELSGRIHEAPDYEWQEHGYLFKCPLETASPTPPPSHHLYFASIHLGEDRDVPSSSSPAASPTDSFMGMVILDQSSNVLMEMKKAIGPLSTKIESDYMALILSLEWTQSAASFQHVLAYTNSIVIYNEMKGKWTVYNTKILWSQAMMYIHKFQIFEMHLIAQNKNQHATRLARDAINSNPLVGSINASSSHETIINVNEAVLEDCPICLEERSESVMVTVTPCSHRFCMSCVIQHMEFKVQACQVPIQCPHSECKSSFSLEQCRATLSQKWFNLLMQAMREASIPEQDRVYCPFPRCSALMLKKDLERTFQATSSSSSSSYLFNSSIYNCVACVECRLFFCHYCRVPWHIGMSCEEFQNSALNGKDTPDSYIYRLARDQKWQRCKKCRHMIERTEGCCRIICRCGHEFCYNCGSGWVDKNDLCKCSLIFDEFNPILELDGHGILGDTDSDGSDQSDDEDDSDEDDDEDIEILGSYCL